MAMSSRPGWIDWRYSEAREILLNDLAKNILQPTVTTKQAWTVYQCRPAFNNIVFEQLAAHLKDHQQQIAGKTRLSVIQLDTFAP